LRAAKNNREPTYVT